MSHTLPWSYLTICMCCEPNSGIHESRDIWSSPFLSWNHFLAYYFSLFFTHSKFYQGSLALELTRNPFIRCWLDNSPIQYYNIKIYFSTNNPTTTFLDIGRKECKPTIDHLYLWLSGHLSRVFLTFKAIACWNCWRCSTTYTTRFTTFSLNSCWILYRFGLITIRPQVLRSSHYHYFRFSLWLSALPSSILVSYHCLLHL